MKYYTEGFISGIDTELVQSSLWFKPTPPFLLSVEDNKFCLLMPQSGKDAKILYCDAKERIKLSILRIDVSTALMLMTSHQKIHITTADETVDQFVEWRTV